MDRVYKISFLILVVLVSFGVGKYFHLTEIETVSREQKNKENSLTQGRKQLAGVRRHLTNESKKIYKESENKKKEGIYYWTDNNDVFHATNKRVPENVDSFNFIAGAKRDDKRTPVKIIGNAVYVPVTLRNNGIIVKTEMLVDTGCTTTVINTALASQLNLKRTGGARSVVADGRIVYGGRTKISAMEVGPFTEYNLEITYQKHAGSRNKGLLGMDFLKNHPFKINVREKVIIWQ